MCQDLLLGWLDCLFAMCGAKTETLTVVHEFTFLSEMSKVSEIFTQYFYTNFLIFPKFLEFCELHKYTKFPDCYRLSCFWQILFSMHCALILMDLWVVPGGMNHGEVGQQ